MYVMMRGHNGESGAVVFYCGLSVHTPTVVVQSAHNTTSRLEFLKVPAVSHLESLRVSKRARLCAHMSPEPCILSSLVCAVRQ